MMNSKKNIILFSLFICSLYSSAQLSNTALYFDGINDEVAINQIPAYAIGPGDFTIEAWIRDEATPATTTEQTIFCSYFASIAGFRFGIWNGNPYLILGGGFGFPITITGFDLRDNNCHHVAVKRLAGTIIFNIDGLDYGTGTGSFDSILYHPFYIGAYDNGQNVFNSFKGLIKEVRFWNVARTASEIQNNMTTVLGSGSPGLIGYWRCNDGAGSGIVQDYSGMNNPGSVGFFGNPGSEPAWSSGCTSCIPLANVSAGGPVTFCPGGNVSINATTGSGYSFQWKKNGMIISGATASTYTANATGSYQAVVTSPCGSAVSNAVNVTVVVRPSPTLAVSGPLTFCNGGNVSLSVNAGAGASYIWKKNGNPIAGANSSLYSASASGSYKCVKTNSYGCSGASNTVTVTVNYLPTSTVTPQGPTTFCNGDSVKLAANSGTNLSYQWKKGNNVNIQGATTKNYFAKTAGDYKVKVTNLNGCTKLSQPVTVNVPCRESGELLLNNDFHVTVFPNPSNNIFILRVNGTGDKNITFRITDALGRVIKNYVKNTGPGEFNIDDLNAGIYNLEVFCGSNKKMLRMIKTGVDF